MAPRAGKDKSTEEDEDILQAVILADSYNSRFKPLTVNKPRSLLPICNVALLEWTFEALASAGVQEIFVFCGSHAEKIKEAIRNSRWNHSSMGMKIIPIVSPESRSLGDAMRELDARQLITSDFILITGDVVSTLKLDDIVKEHKERRKSNKDAIMTMVFKPMPAHERPRYGTDTSVLLLDSRTSQCVHYEYVPAGIPSVQLPREVIQKHLDLDVRVDLLDCSIDICSVDVPPLFTENFDYQHLRTDFVHGVLTSDLLNKSIYCHIAKSGYVARVKDTKAYATVSKDVLSRRVFPLVPDDNHLSSINYELKRGHVYIAKEAVVLSRTCKIGPNAMIGASTTIEDDVVITNSVIGNYCTVGRGTRIHNSYIWDGAMIDSDCSVEESIIGSSVRLLPSSKVGRGCLIDDETVLGPSADLGEFRKISRTAPEVDDLDEEQVKAVPVDGLKLGEQAEAYVWPDQAPNVEDDDSEVENEFESPNQIKLGRLGDKGEDLDSDEPEEDTDESLSTAPSSPGSFASEDSTSLPTSSIPNLSLDTSSSDFQSECIQSLDRAFEEGHSISDAAIELKTLRMASNVPLRQVKELVMAQLVGRIKIMSEPAAQRQQVTVVMDRWGGLISALGGDDPVENISILQRHCASKPATQKIFGLVLGSMYNDDIVDEDDIKEWVMSPKSRGNAVDQELAAGMDDCLRQGARMLHQLQQMEDDDEEESE